MTQNRTEVNPGAGSDLEFLKNLLNHADRIDHETLISQVFSPENLDRLLRVQEQNPGATVLLAEACKAQKIPVGKLEQALAQRQKVVREAEAGAKAQALRQQFYAVPGGIDLPLPAGCAIPKGYVVRAGETSVADADMGKLMIAPAGLAVLTRYRDIESGLTQVQIGAWADGATQWHTIEVPRKTICDTRAVVELANYDFPVSSLSAKAVVEFFVQFETKNRRAIPEQWTTSHLGWQTLYGETLGFLAGPDRFVPVASDAGAVRFFPANPGDAQVTAGFTQGGALAEWIREVGQPILGYPKAAVGMLASFGVPILKLLHHPNFVVDYAGLTSLGKTTAQRAAGSIWGIVDEARPEANVLQSWNATQVGASEMGRILSGLPLILDDSKTARNDKSVAEILYLITNAKGRAKGAKDGGMRETPTVKTILISSGEKPLTAFTKDGGVRTRVLVIGGSPFGEVSADSREAVQALTNACADHYGVAGPAWMQWVIDRTATDLQAWTQTYRSAKTRYTSQAQSAGEGRLLAHRAFLEAVGGLLGQALPNLAPALNTLMASTEWTALWSDMTVQAADPLDAQAALEHIGSWAQSHIEQFEGQRNTNSMPPNEWLGKWEGTQVSMLKHSVDDRLREQGWDPQAIVAQWRAEGWLKSGEGRNADPKVTIGGQRGRNAYVLTASGLSVALADGEDDQGTASEDPIGDDYVPF